jgi:sulfite exporter TauE/SafE
MDYTLIVLTGFFGSMHCVGMCGAIVAAYSTQQNFQDGAAPGKWDQLLKHLAYNFGRVLSYILMGALLGTIGGGISGLKSVGEWFSTAAGVVLVVSGIWISRIFPRTGLAAVVPFGREKKSFLLSLYTQTYGALLNSPSLESKFYIGLLTPLLPCGLLYSMFLMAAASGSAVNGAVTMAFFGCGIVPSLVVVGFVSTFFRFRLRMAGDKLAAVTIILMGIIMVMRGLGIPMPWMTMESAHHHMGM